MADSEGRRLRANAIGVPGIVFFVVAAVGPMAAVVGASPLVFEANGAGASGTYLIAGLLFALFSVGYVAMSRYISNAGGFATYVARGFDNRAGAAASLIALLTYGSVLCALWGVFGIFAEQTALERLSIHVSWEVWALGGIVVVGILAYNRVELSARLLGVLLIAEVLVILVLDFAIAFSGGEGGGAALSFIGLKPSIIFSGSVGLAFMWALTSFGGFEATVVFSEEARDRRRTIPRATYLAVAFIGVFYAFTTWALSNAVGTSQIKGVANEDPTGFIFATAESYVGTVWPKIMSILVVTSFFAVVLGFTNILGRYIFAVARAGVLPAQLSTTHHRHQSPSRASLVASATSLVVVGGFALGHADPFTYLYTWLLALGTVAVLTIFAMTSLSIGNFFRKFPENREGVWRTVIAPILSAAGFFVAIWLALENWDLLTAGQTGVVTWLWVLIPIVGLVGWIIGSRRGDQLNFEDVADVPLVEDPDSFKEEVIAASNALSKKEA